MRPTRAAGETARPLRANGRYNMDSNLLVQGVELMLLGMGIVFGFLTILVFTLRGMSRFAARFAEDQPALAEVPQPIEVADNRPLVAVISAAVARYRSTRSA